MEKIGVPHPDHSDDIFPALSSLTIEARSIKTIQRIYKEYFSRRNAELTTIHWIVEDLEIPPHALDFVGQTWRSLDTLKLDLRHFHADAFTSDHFQKQAAGGNGNFSAQIVFAYQ